MAISRELADHHAAVWSERLQRTKWPYRHFWPRRLFRHEPLQNAAQILRAGQLFSRRDVERRRVSHLDIAAPSVLSTRDSAYDFVRLYFRPRNPTQYWIEGVRKPAECMGQDSAVQAAMLVMFVLDAKVLLIRQGVCFSNGNMQSDRTLVGDDETFFKEINFEWVYHEGPFDSQSPVERDIIRIRNAEILVPSPLSLRESVKAVVCRAPAERATLLHLLGEEARQWSGRIIVDSMPGYFYREKAFVGSVEADSAGVTVSFNPRRGGQRVPVRVAVRDSVGHIRLQSRTESLDLSRKWRWECNFEVGIYLCSIELEGHLAHQSTFLIDDAPF